MNYLNWILIFLLAPISVYALVPSAPSEVKSALCNAILEKPIAVDKVKSAIDSGDDVNVYCVVKGATASSPLYIALKSTSDPQTDDPVSQLLIEKGADPEFINHFPKWKHKVGLISNFAAVTAKGNLKLVSAFLQKKPDLKNANGQNAVNLAFVNKHWDVAQLLLESGANKYSIGGLTALMLAISNGAPDDFLNRLFEEWNFQYDNTDLTDGYLLAMINNLVSPVFIQKIINQGANPKSILFTSGLSSLVGKGVQRVNAFTIFAHRQPYGPTPRLTDLATYLLSLGLDPSENNPILVPTFANYDVLNWLAFFLLDHGANPNAIVPLDSLNPGVAFSALQLAIYEGGGGSLPLIKALLDHGADIEYTTNTNATALCFAVGSTGSVSYRVENALELIRRGANVNGPCGDQSILCRAKMMVVGKWDGAQQVYDTLVQKGARLGQCKY